MDKSYFCFLLEWADMLNLLTTEQCGQLIKAMVSYEKDNISPDFSDDSILQFAWLSNIKPKLDSMKEHYREKVRQASEAGKASAEKRKQNKQNQHPSTSVEIVEQNEHPSTDSTNNNIVNNLVSNLNNKKEKPTKEKEGWEEIVKAYEQRFPMTLSSYKAQELQDIFDNYGKDAVLFAIKEARSGNAKKPIPYIRTVAMNYSRKDPEPMKESPQEIGERIRAETEKRRAEGKSVSMDEIKKRVREEMRRKGMTIVGEGNTG